MLLLLLSLLFLVIDKLAREEHAKDISLAVLGLSKAAENVRMDDGRSVLLPTTQSVNQYFRLNDFRADLCFYLFVFTVYSPTEKIVLIWTCNNSLVLFLAGGFGTDEVQ